MTAGCGVGIDAGLPDLDPETRKAWKKELAADPTQLQKTGDPRLDVCREPFVDDSAPEDPGAVAQGEVGPPDSGNLLQVPAGVYAALLAQPAGQGLDPLMNVDGMPAYAAQIAAHLPVAGAPNAFCTALTIPIETATACATLTPELVDGGSHDPDYQGESGPLAGLEATLDKSEVCGVGQHDVVLTTYDFDGNSSSCTTTVTLCDAADAGCQLQKDTTIAISDRPAEGITCRWHLVKSIHPKKSSITRPSKKSVQQNGAGPGHYNSSWVTGGTRYCWSDDYEESHNPLHGDVNIDIDVRCVNAKGEKVEPKCESKVELRAYYRSKLHARTSASGLPCLWGYAKVEAKAQDETTFTVKGKPVFNKAAVVHNGTSVTRGASLALGANLGTSKDGAAANVGVTAGVTYTFDDKTAKVTRMLRARGYKQVKTPVLAHFQAEGLSYLKVQDRSFGLTRVATGHWIIALVGKSTCPGAGTTYWGHYFNDTRTLENEKQSDIDSVNAFFSVRDVSARFTF